MLRDWLVEALHLHQLRLAAQKLAVQSAVFGVAGVLGIVGVGFLVAALTVFLIHAWGPIVALLVLGAALLILAGIAVLVARNQGGETVHQAPPPAPRPAFRPEMLPVAAGLATTVVRSVREAGGFVPLATALAGLGGGLYLRARLRRRSPAARV